MNCKYEEESIRSLPAPRTIGGRETSEAVPHEPEAGVGLENSQLCVLREAEAQHCAS